MIISVTNLKTNENQEFKVNNVVYKAALKLCGTAFSVVPCKNCLGTPTNNSFPELIDFLAKYGYHF